MQQLLRVLGRPRPIARFALAALTAAHLAPRLGDPPPQQQQLPDGTADTDKQPHDAQLPPAVVPRLLRRPLQAGVIHAHVAHAVLHHIDPRLVEPMAPCAAKAERRPVALVVAQLVGRLEDGVGRPRAVTTQPRRERAPTDSALPLVRDSTSGRDALRLPSIRRLVPRARHRRQRQPWRKGGLDRRGNRRVQILDDERRARTNVDGDAHGRAPRGGAHSRPHHSMTWQHRLGDGKHSRRHLRWRARRVDAVLAMGERFKHGLVPLGERVNEALVDPALLSTTALGDALLGRLGVEAQVHGRLAPLGQHLLDRRVCQLERGHVCTLEVELRKHAPAAEGRALRNDEAHARPTQRLSQGPRNRREGHELELEFGHLVGVHALQQPVLAPRVDRLEQDDHRGVVRVALHERREARRLANPDASLDRQLAHRWLVDRQMADRVAVGGIIDITREL